MIVRAYEAMKGEQAAAPGAEADFTDQGRISRWASASVAAAAEMGLVQGRANKAFEPNGKMTRAESAQVIYNLLGK